MADTSTSSQCKEHGPLYLGFDLSTQQLKVVALVASKGDSDSELEIHSSFAVHFDDDLTQYKTQGGVLPNQAEPGVATTPVLMWVEALETVLERMKQSRFPFHRAQAISGAAQQHGSVYWSMQAPEALDALSSSDKSPTALVTLLKDAFSIEQSPIWQDTSTTKQCQELEEYLGNVGIDVEGGHGKETVRQRGQQRLADMTGSRAYERYTASQILKIVQTNPEAYKETSRISLVSSFLASLLMGHFAAIDVADGSGMNLLNMETKTWEPRLTRFISQGGKGGYDPGAEPPLLDTLAEKLGEVDSTGRKVQGVLSKWFVDRYGFRNDVKVVSFTGDNPATVMAMKAVQGDAIVSLGTSDTLLLYTNTRSKGTSEAQLSSTSSSQPAQEQARARLSVGYLCHPVDPSGYLMLYCAKNGSLARQKVRDLYADHDWSRFDQLLEKGMESIRTGDASRTLGYYFFQPEIWPPIQGVYRFQDGEKVQEFQGVGPESGLEYTQERNVLAICESQFLAMRLRSSLNDSTTGAALERLSPPGISRILATGGAASNQTVLQLLANVFGVPVIRTVDDKGPPGSAAWGAARKAYLFGSGGDDGADLEKVRGELTAERPVQENSTDQEGYGDRIEPDLVQSRYHVSRIQEYIRLEERLLQESASRRL